MDLSGVQTSIDISGVKLVLRTPTLQTKRYISQEQIQKELLELNQKKRKANHDFYWSSNEEFCNFLEDKLDTDLGYYYYKKYISAAFWAQMSMPINLALTFITALTTAQANTSGMLSQEMYANISIGALILSVLNTFFRPHVQMTKNGEMMKAWSQLGTKFEEEYYSNHTVETSITNYKAIQKDVNELRDKEGPDTMNFLTDLIHLMVRNCCMRRRQKWLDMNRAIQEQARARAKGCNDGDCCFPGTCNDPRMSEKVITPVGFENRTHPLEHRRRSLAPQP